MSRGEQLGSLRRLALATRDIQNAHDGCRVLEAEGSYHGMQFGGATWAMWTGIVVSYCRPFTSGKLRLKDDRWQVFLDETLQARHDGLRRLRDKLFAHNDVRHEREVVVLPPGSFLERGAVKLQETVFTVEDATATRRLCEFQLERMTEEADRLVNDLCAGRRFGEGATLSLPELAEALRH